MKNNNHTVSNEVSLARAVAGKGGKVGNKPPTQPVEPAKPSVEAVASTLKRFALLMAKSWKSFHEACAVAYMDALGAWEGITHTASSARSRESVNAFHKAFKPVLSGASDMEDGTIRNLLAKCRKENGLPDGISPQRKKQMAIAKAKAQRVKDATKQTKGDNDLGTLAAGIEGDAGCDVISITIASKTSSFALSADGEEVDNSVDGLYAILVKLQKVYGETLLEAINRLMDSDVAVNQ